MHVIRQMKDLSAISIWHIGESFLQGQDRFIIRIFLVFGKSACVLLWIRKLQNIVLCKFHKRQGDVYYLNIRWGKVTTSAEKTASIRHVCQWNIHMSHVLNSSQMKRFSTKILACEFTQHTISWDWSEMNMGTFGQWTNLRSKILRSKFCCI